VAHGEISNAKLQTPNKVSQEMISLVDLPHMAVAWAEGRPWHCRRDSALISMPSATEIPLQCPVAWRGFRSAKHKLVLKADGTSVDVLRFGEGSARAEKPDGGSVRAGEIAELRKLNVRQGGLNHKGTEAQREIQTTRF